MKAERRWLCCCCFSSLRLSDLTLEKSAGNPCNSTHLSEKHLQRDKSCLVPQSLTSILSPQTARSTWRDAGGPQLSLLSAPSGLSQHHREPGASCTEGATPANTVGLCCDKPLLNSHKAACLPVLIQGRKSTFVYCAEI